MARLKLCFLLAALVFATFASAHFINEGYLSDLLEWVGSIGFWGNILFITFYLITSFPVPMGTTPLALAAGFLYGIPIGFVTVTIGSVGGATLAFWVCKKYLAEWVAGKIKSNPGLLAVMKAVEKHSFKFCFFVRLSPIPFGLQNSLFAISKITFFNYFAASFLGLFPEQLMLVYFGSTAKELKDIFQGKQTYGSFQQILMIGQLLVCILILAFLLYTGRKAFHQAVKDDEENFFVHTVPLTNSSPIAVALLE